MNALSEQNRADLRTLGLPFDAPATPPPAPSVESLAGSGALVAVSQERAAADLDAALAAIAARWAEVETIAARMGDNHTHHLRLANALASHGRAATPMPCAPVTVAEVAGRLPASLLAAVQGAR